MNISTADFLDALEAYSRLDDSAQLAVRVIVGEEVDEWDNLDVDSVARAHRAMGNLTADIEEAFNMYYDDYPNEANEPQRPADYFFSRRMSNRRRASTRIQTRLSLQRKASRRR